MNAIHKGGGELIAGCPGKLQFARKFYESIDFSKEGFIDPLRCRIARPTALESNARVHCRGYDLQQPLGCCQIYGHH